MGRWLIVIGMSFWATMAYAVTYYVDNTPPGTPAADCTAAQNINTPHDTIAEGIGCLAAGDTLYIRAGTYTENGLTIGTQCTAGSPCTIAGYPGDSRPMLRPTATDLFIVTFGVGDIPQDSYVTLRDLDMDGINQGLNMICVGVYWRHVTLENLYCVNAPRNGFYLGGGDSWANSDHAIVRNNTIVNCGRIQEDWEFDTKGNGVYTVSAFSVIENNLIDGCHSGGFEVGFDLTHDTIFRNNIIRNSGSASPWGLDPSGPTYGRGFGIGGRGVYGPNGPINNQIYNNVMYNIKGANGAESFCFAFSGTDGPNLIANNTCYDVDRPWVVLCNEPVAALTFQNNLYAQMANTSPDECGTLSGTISHNLFNPTVSSTFVNAGTGDFHLLSGATARDAGTIVAAVTMDISGITRPQGSAYDIGAYEFVNIPARRHGWAVLLHTVQ